MAVNIKELLDLPVEERRRIAEIMIGSLPDDDADAEEPEDELAEDLTEEQLRMLEERYERYERGESRTYTIEEIDSYIRKKIQEQSGV
jgi:DNA-binding transcriptional MerR regulator